MNQNIRLWTCAAAVALCIIPGISISAEAQSRTATSVAGSKTLLDTINLSTWNPRSIVVSPDIRSIAYIQRSSSENKVQIIRDGQEGTLFDAIKHDSLMFSPDGKRLAYQATQGRHQVMVIDESVSSHYDSILDGSLIFSPNGKRYAYIAKRKSKWFVVVDGTISPPYRRIMPYSLQFSPASNTVAYVATTNIDAKHVMVIDGLESSHYDNIWIGPSLFDRRGMRTAYVTQTGNDWSVTVDSQQGPSFDRIVVTSLIFSQDGQHAAYLAKKEGKWVAVRDGTIDTPFDAIRTQSLTFSPDGNHLAYAAKNNNTWTVIVDGKMVGQTYDDIDGIQPQFSPDGSQLAFGVRLGTQWGVVVNGTLGIPHTDIGNDTLRFSADSRHFAYAAELEGGWFMMLDGQPDQFSSGEVPMTDRTFTRLGTKGPVFSPDGKRFAYSVAQGLDKLGVIIDGQLGRPHWDLIEESLVFSPDGSKVAYVTGSQDGKWRVIIERKTIGSAYDGIGASGVLFSSDSQHVLFSAERDQKWMAVIDGHESELFDHLLTGDNGQLSLNELNELRYIGRQGNKIYLVETKVGAV